MSFNKCQGQTLDKIAIDLRSQVFAHGYLYVATSRIRQYANICFYILRGQEEDKDKNVTFVKNVVYKDLIEIANKDSVNIIVDD
jgi:ATP-dependent exoDNAse (exonuclease V) alpha subunit